MYSTHGHLLLPEHVVPGANRRATGRLFTPKTKTIGLIHRALTVQFQNQGRIETHRLHGRNLIFFSSMSTRIDGLFSTLHCTAAQCTRTCRAVALQTSGSFRITLQRIDDVLARDEFAAVSTARFRDLNLLTGSVLLVFSKAETEDTGHRRPCRTLVHSTKRPITIEQGSTLCFHNLYQQFPHVLQARKRLSKKPSLSTM